LVRVTRIAVVSADLLHGAVGKIADDRLDRIRSRLAGWIRGTSAVSTAEKEEKEQQGAGGDK
jgi:hypothetical protein